MLSCDQVCDELFSAGRRKKPFPCSGSVCTAAVREILLQVSLFRWGNRDLKEMGTFPRISQTGFEFWHLSPGTMLLSLGNLSWPELMHMKVTATGKAQSHFSSQL